MPDWSVVIPVYRERGIQRCIDRVRTVASNRDIEIIISGADGSLTAGRILRPGAGLRVIDAPKGRGIQIAKAISVATAEKILVLHADTQLPNGAFELMDGVLSMRDAGAFRFRMDSKKPILVLSACITNIRASLTRIPFGDQGHFFRKKILLSIGGYPMLPLFEDVSFMERLKRKKISIGFVFRPVVTSSRRYRALGYWRTTLRNWKIQFDWKQCVSADVLALRYWKGVEKNESRKETALIIFHRALRPGFVKTRLAKRVGDTVAINLYRAFLIDLEKTVLETDATVFPYVDCTDDREALFWPLAMRQSGEDLGQRMANAIRETIDRGFKKIILIGSDLPHLRKSDIDAAIRMLSDTDVVFGPATDGGYYLVGVNAATFDPSIFALASWSHERVLSESRELCEASGLSVALCEPMRDFDTAEDIDAWFLTRASKKEASVTWDEWNRILTLF